LGNIDPFASVISRAEALLPAGRKFCKITQTGRKKKVIGRGNWRPYGRRFWTKAAETKYSTENVVFCMKFCTCLKKVSLNQLTR
jgi:hypothetical protein